MYMTEEDVFSICARLSKTEKEWKKKVIFKSKIERAVVTEKWFTYIAAREV